MGSNDFLDLLKTEPCASDPGGSACTALVAATLGSFAYNYTYILNLLTAHLAADSGHATLLIMTYYNPWSGTGDPMEGLLDRVLLGSDLTIDCAANATDPYRIGVNDIIWCVGSAYGAIMVDGYTPFVGKAPILTHITDAVPDVHPTNAGHAILAQAFREAYLNR